ncbi:MAG: peptide chain release factor N(5)-glutamine methyltransferase [Patescibacteria group bacterium]
MTTTIETLVRDTTDTLKDNGYVHGEREASFMVSKAIGQDSAWIISHFENIADPEKVVEVEKMVSQRLKGCPLAYILGEQPFLGWKFVADKRGLIPRPETELLVEILVKTIKEFKLEDKKFLEIGTGSGPIAISLKKFFPGAAVTATDISDEALELAEENAKNIQADIDFVEGNLFEPVSGQKFDLIVANLPYVPTERLSFVSDQILDWEPMIAVEAGEDGLKYIAPFIAELSNHLETGAIAAIEMWHDHGDAVKKLSQEHLPNYEVVVEKDLAGFDRYAIFLPL